MTDDDLNAIELAARVTMTDAELSALDRHAAAHVVALAIDVRRLVAEVRRLRAMPVIATCGGCVALLVRPRPHRLDRVHLTERNEPNAWLCHHWEVRCNEPNDPRPDAPPPAWCPLRGAR